MREHVLPLQRRRVLSAAADQPRIRATPQEIAHRRSWLQRSRSHPAGDGAVQCHHRRGHPAHRVLQQHALRDGLRRYRAAARLDAAEPVDPLLDRAWLCLSRDLVVCSRLPSVRWKPGPSWPCAATHMGGTPPHRGLALSIQTPGSSAAESVGPCARPLNRGHGRGHTTRALPRRAAHNRATRHKHSSHLARASAMRLSA